MSPQQTIAHYRITSKLGEGGMGAVYRATDTKLNRDVAIKVLPDAFAADLDRLARFTREAQVLASLNHPNIAAIYGVEDRALVLELVDGAEPKGPLSETEALPLVHQLIDALEYAHDKSIVHRDLKPANLKITPDGRLKVLDFGLAKALASDTPAANPAHSPTLTMRATMAGVIMGTAAYMSPEQARGHDADRRADIWSFGVVVYKLLTGRMLFEGPTVSDTLAAVLTRDPDFDAVPPRFRRLVRLCLARDLRQRLSHISAARVLLDEPAADVAAPVVKRGPWIAIAAASTVVALAAAGIAWRVSRRDPAPLMRLDVNLGPDSSSGGSTLIALTPDGTRLLYRARNAAGREVLAIRTLSESKMAVIPETEGLFDVVPSPDGQWVAYVADGKLRKAPLQGGAPVLLADGIANSRGLAWAKDGSIILSLSPTSGLYRVPPDGGKPEPLTQPSAKGQMTHRWPQVLPGGRSVLFTAHTSTTGLNNAEIDVLDLKTTQWRTVVKGGFDGRYLASGHLVFARGSTLLAVPFDPEAAEARGTPVPVLDDVASLLTIGSGRFTFAPATGLFAYVAGTATAQATPLVWVDAEGKEQPALGANMATRAPAISPDGRLVALSAGSVGMDDIKVWDPARDVMTPITFNSHENRNPVWTPDGKHLVYNSFFNGVHTLWWARADGGGEPHKLLERPTLVIAGSFTPDGRRLAVQIHGAETAADLWTVPLDLAHPDKPAAGTPEPFLRSPANEYSPRLSPDGRWIAYTSDESGHPEIYVRPFPGAVGKWQISAGGGFFPEWSRDLRRIYFAASSGQMMVADCDIRAGAFAPGKSRPWGEARMRIPAAPEVSSSFFTIAPDGKRMLAHVLAVRANEPDPGGRATFLLNFFDELRRRIP